MRKQIINALFMLKYSVRKNSKIINEIRDQKSTLEREKKHLENNPFNQARIKKLDYFITEYELTLNDFYAMQRGEKLRLSKMIIQYDLLPIDRHEQAQLLNISHINYDHFLKQDFTDGSLTNAILFHAECYGENEDYIGESGNRDSPLFDAMQWHMIKTMRDNPQIQESANKAMSDLFGNLPTYSLSLDAQGNEIITRNAPNLSLVENSL